MHMKEKHLRDIVAALKAELIALLRLFDRLVHARSSTEWRAHLNGASLTSEDLHSRLRRVRNLSDVVARLPDAYLTAPGTGDAGFNATKPTPYEHVLRSVANLRAGTGPERQELASLVSDVWDAALAVLPLLESRKNGPKERREIRRHLDHIASHFDYAESSVIGCLEAGDKKSDSDKRRSSHEGVSRSRSRRS